MDLESLKKALNAFPDDTNFSDLRVIQEDTYKAKLVLEVGGVEISVSGLSFDPLPEKE